MYRLLRLSGLLLTVALVPGACDDGADPTAAPEPGPALLQQGNGPPAASGPYVIRYEGNATFLIVDPTSGAGAFFGGDVVALCAGDPSGLDPVSIKDIDVPEDANRINQMVKGDDVRASYWDPVPTTCADVLATGPTATGTADMVSTDNDLLVFLNPDNRNANAFGVQAHGFMWTAAGETVRVNAHSRCVWDGVDGATLRCNDKVVAN